jgi:hypothetical protein
MINFLIAVGVIFILMLGWIVVQHLVGKFAAHHPELGPAKEEGSGCGGCSCQTGTCKKHSEN